MKTWLRLTLITMSVGGGFTGFVLVVNSLFQSGERSAVNTMLFVLFAVSFAFVTASGLLFTYDSGRTTPLLIALAMQIPWISNQILVYKFAAGAHLILNIGSSADTGRSFYFGFESALGSSFLFTVNSSEDIPFRIGINLVALALFILLAKAAPKALPPSSTANNVTEIVQN